MTQSGRWRCDRFRVAAFTILACLGFLPAAALAQATGQLQIHHIRVGQGDAALIISPLGETMPIDSGPESASSCASSTGMPLGLGGGSGSVAVTTQSSCSWSANSSVPWIAAPGGVRLGAGTVLVTVTPNTARPARVRQVTIGGKVATITQSGRSALPNDFDGDGRSDPTVFRPSNGVWYSRFANGAGRGLEWGVASDVPVPGDYDGDGRSDVAVYRPSTGHWFILKSGSNHTQWETYQWGTTGDVPVPADYDGDGRSDLPTYRPSNGLWSVLTSASGFSRGLVYQWGSIFFGQHDVPLPEDYDGDGKADLGLYRAPHGRWLVLLSTTAYQQYVNVQWGSTGDVPISGDDDGDVRGDIAVYRPSNGTWYILKSSTGFSGGAGYVWGAESDVPIGGDFDGDGISDIAVYRPSTADWFVLKSSAGFTAWDTYQWGQTGDIPVGKFR